MYTWHLRGGRVRGSDYFFGKWRHSFLKTEYFVAPSVDISEKKIRQKATENWFLGDIASFMPTGYSFRSFLK
jgi:hypothetical protein